MADALVTGSTGLVGAEAVTFLIRQGMRVVGIDNDSRRTYFGDEASTRWRLQDLQSALPGYSHHDFDIRDQDQLAGVFQEHGKNLRLVVHCAAQPSHDWAAADPCLDFAVNATGTLNLLDGTRRFAPEATFVFTSTNKVYGDRVNQLPFVEKPSRWELPTDHPLYDNGVDESMSIDQTLHSLFGASKTAADILVQEFGRYYGMNTATFRCGCITGPGQAGAAQHGFLSYLIKCAVLDQPYTIIGYGGKQVRDNIHAADLVRMFWAFHQSPTAGAVYNASGGRKNSCSVVEAIAICEELTGRRMNASYRDAPRRGDHIWYIGDTRKFQTRYPDWRIQYDLRATIKEIIEAHRQRGSY